MVIDMLTRLPIDADLETASWTMLELAEAAHVAGEWTQEELDQMIRAFDTRGLYECERVITDPERVAGGRTMYLRPKTAAVTPFFPGPMQLRHEVPEGSDNVVVRFRLGASGGPADNPVGVLVLLKREDAPLVFDYTLTAIDKSSDGGKGSVREVIKTEGDWDLALPASLLGESDNQLVLRGFRPGEVVHVALANVGPSESVASGVAVVSLPTEFLDEGTVHVDADLGDTDSDSSGSGGDGPGAPVVDADPAMASCACRSGEGQGAGLLALTMLGLAGQRRRRA
jgi:MYXO-CTERM domain-containing protein